MRRKQAPLPADFFEAEAFHFCLAYRYQHSLSPETVRHFQGRILQLHLSLLPWNRGSDPHLWSFLEDTPKGVTIYRPDATMDAGDILLQQEVSFTSSDATLRSTYTLLSTAMERLFVKYAEQLLAQEVPFSGHSSQGSFHTACDKVPWLHLLEERWWDTPTASLIGGAKEPHPPKNETRVALRAAGPDDVAFVFQLVNEPDVRAMSFCSAAIPWDVHCRWFAAELASENPFYIALYNGCPCGYVRFKKEDPLHGEEWTLSLAICPGFRGKGLGTDMVRAASRAALCNTRIKRLRARVKQQNAASLRTFDKSGFVRTDAVSHNGENAVSFLYPGYEE